MPRIALDLNKAEDRQKVKGQWRVAPGLVPGQPNEGLTAQLLNTPARLAEYDDSGWEICNNVRESRSVGFTFAWYRIAVEIPHVLMASTWPAPACGSRRTSTTTGRSGSMVRLTALLASSLASTPRSALRSATVRCQGRAMSLPSWC